MVGQELGELKGQGQIFRHFAAYRGMYTYLPRYMYHYCNQSVVDLN